MRFALLVLIGVTVLASCGRNKEVSITWNNNQAVSVSIPVSDSVVVSVEGSEFNVLGTLDIGSDAVIFSPAVPFERGQTYSIRSGIQKLYSFTVPVDTTAIAPRLLQSYPSCDTVPENLLKIYLAFDQPMMEGRSEDFVTLYDDSTGDTVRGAFLDLKPELWNEDQTVLTLWLDPGRIKQDLIPNKELGTVLQQGHGYTLRVAPGWRSKAGLKSDVFVRKYFTTQRDTKKPDVATWIVDASRAGAVEINVRESLDWSLLNSTVRLRRGSEQVAIKGATNECERGFLLSPVEPLVPGAYTIDIESRLEDLAGNNLNRLFETDVTDGKPASENKPVYTLGFTIR